MLKIIDLCLVMDELRQDFFHSRMPFLSLTWLKIGPNDLAFDQPRTNPQGSGWSDTLHYRECQEDLLSPHSDTWPQQRRQ